MKKYICILFSILCLFSCDEDETIDITVMPAITSTGENTFGCLVDGWIYVGGRYKNIWFWEDWASIRYKYNPEENEMVAAITVKEDMEMSFTILAPEEGKECSITGIMFGDEALENGTALINRFDQKRKIISGTFTNNNRLTNGRFDVHYRE